MLLNDINLYLTCTSLKFFYGFCNRVNAIRKKSVVPHLCVILARWSATAFLQTTFNIARAEMGYIMINLEHRFTGLYMFDN